MNTFSEYTQLAERTMMDSCRCAEYLDSGLISEVGELCGLYAKSVRGDYDLMERSRDVLKEAGDCCWFVAMKLMNSFHKINEILEIDDLSIFNKHSLSGLHDKKTMAELFLDAAFYATSIVEISYDKKSLRRNVTMFFATLASLLNRFGYTLAEAMEVNIAKLSKRKELGKIVGSGDNREELTDAPFCGCID